LLCRFRIAPTHSGATKPGVTVSPAPRAREVVLRSARHPVGVSDLTFSIANNQSAFG
jgi:hypothetical protein